MSKTLQPHQPSDLTHQVIIKALKATVDVINHSQTEWGGNMAASVIKQHAVTYGGFKDWVDDKDLILRVTEQAVNGLFEFEMTQLRLMLTAMSLSENGTVIPPECTRDVQGELVERIIGWDSHVSNILGLLPLGIVTTASALMIILAMTDKGRLTLFDATHPLSLVAATSNGHVTFGDEKGNSRAAAVVGDPHDVVIGKTQVSYGLHWGKWGFKSD